MSFWQKLNTVQRCRIVKYAGHSDFMRPVFRKRVQSETEIPGRYSIAAQCFRSILCAGLNGECSSFSPLRQSDGNSRLMVGEGKGLSGLRTVFEPVARTVDDCERK